MARHLPGEKCDSAVYDRVGFQAEEVFRRMNDERPDDNSLLFELAAAEAAEAEARTRAERARARVADMVEERQPQEFLEATEESLVESDEVPPVPRVRRRVWPTVGIAFAALLTVAALTAIGLMLWQHSRVVAQRAQDQRFVDAARDGVVALLSIDQAHARADVQRVLDLSTGQFHDQFVSSADDFVKTAVTSKAVTKGTVNVTALDSVDGDRAVVLVAATSEVTNANGAHQDSRPFRISVTVTRDGEAYKMSDVEFVP